MGNKKSTVQNTKIKSRAYTYLGDEDIEYLQEITNFERSEILEWYRSFMNECPNGFLDKKTLIKTFEKIYPNGKPHKICSKLFNAFDTDKNNKIDFREYLIGISHLSSQDLRKKLQLTFRIYDSDSNGVVNKKELEKMMIAILELNGVRDKTGDNCPKLKVANVFKRFNKELDESISETEFIDGCLNDQYLVTLFAEYRV